MSFTKSSAESTTAATHRKVQLAGHQRLLSQMSTEEPTTDQTHVMRLAEERVYAYTKTKTPREIREEGRPIYNQVNEILTPFSFKHKPDMLALWDHLLCGSATDVPARLEALSSVALNNELKRIIVRDIRTPSKHKGILKRVLNLGSDSFHSLFAEVDLTSTETAQRNNTREQESRRVAALETLLESKPLDDKDVDPDDLVRTLYGHVRNLSDPVQRNAYLNRFLAQVVAKLKATATAAATTLLNLFVQVYDRLVHHELVTTVSGVTAAYFESHPLDFFRHSLQHMPLLLEPHSNFKSAEAVLDPWQRATLKAIKTGSTILLNLPTSAGKTAVSAGVINDHQDAWFVVPTMPLAEQLTGILLATLLDREARKGADSQRNVRLESESSSYRRFQKAKDNIVVATPNRLWHLLHTGQAPPTPQYIVLDEGHNIGCPTLGPPYEYILKYALFHNIPLMILTATMRDSDYEEMMAWLKRLMVSPDLFAVKQKRRFFNQQRRIFRIDPETQRVTTVVVDPLEYFTAETLRSPTFRHPGLIPGEVLRLYDRIADFPRIPSQTRIPTLDSVEVLEENLFKHLAARPEAFLAATATAATAATATTATAAPALTPYQIYMALKAIKAEQKPLLFFKFDSLACMHLFLTLIHLAQDMSKVVYANFADDQPIIAQYLEEWATLEEAEAGGGSSELADQYAEELRNKRDMLFTTKYSPRLIRFYKEYQESPIDMAALEEFNTKYGATITPDFIRSKRAKHGQKQLSKTAETIKLRTDYKIHNDIKISTYASSTIMKDIRNQINDELDHQRTQTGPFPDMRLLDPAFHDFNDIEETIHWKKWDPLLREWVKPKEGKTVQKKGESETRKQGRPWPSGLVDSPDGPDREYSYNISYEHPVLVGIECGLLFYNALLNPALLRICQLLISKHPLIGVSDKGLVEGVNYPIRGVWIQGALQGEPIEVLDNTLVQQAMGRAGRRGYDREATIYISGADMKNVLLPQYRPVGKNDPAKMESWVEGEEEAFRRFVLTEERIGQPTQPATTTATTTTKITTKTATAATTTTITETTTAAATATNTVVKPGVDVTTMSWEDWVPT